MYQGLDTARSGYIKNLNTLETLFIGDLNTHFEDPYPKNRTKMMTSVTRQKLFRPLKEKGIIFVDDHSVMCGSNMLGTIVHDV